MYRQYELTGFTSKLHLVVIIEFIYRSFENISHVACSSMTSLIFVKKKLDFFTKIK